MGPSVGGSFNSPLLKPELRLEDRDMKYLLSGVAIAAALAIGAPALAQNTPTAAGTPQEPAVTAPGTPQARTATAPKRHRLTAKERHHRGVARRMARRGRATSPGDRTANELNREELGRMQSGSTMPPPTVPTAGPSGGGYVPPSAGTQPPSIGGPRPSGGGAYAQPH